MKSDGFLAQRPTSPGLDGAARLLVVDAGPAAASIQGTADAYANMIITGYPRGERRQNGIDERDAAIEARNRARSSYAGGVGELTCRTGRLRSGRPRSG